MTNVVVPLAANIYFDSSEFYYPKPLIEVRGKPVIEWVIQSLRTLPDPKRFIFILNQADDRKFHLQDTLRLLTDGQCEIVMLEGASKGAMCSVLMAINHIQGPHPLVVANGDQLFRFPLVKVIDEFKTRKLDAGVICFPSVHPRWSYVRLNDQGLVTEAAEKRPVSRNAIAGFYYFTSGQDFVRLSMDHIAKGIEVNGQFYVSQVLNEYVLEDKKVGQYLIAPEDFRTFYSIQKIAEAQREAV